MFKEKGVVKNAVNQKAKNDIVLVVSLLLVVIIATIGLFLFKGEGNTVVVTVDGKVWGEYSLEEENVINITTKNGNNVLVIKDNKAYISSASCPDGICSAHRPINHNGASIICLPNKVVVEVKTKDTTQPDIIV